MFGYIIIRIENRPLQVGKMGLLNNLWGGPGSDGGEVQVDKASTVKTKGNSDDGKRSFAKVVSSESLGDSHELKHSKRRSKDMQGGARLSGAKRPRSPNAATCGRCFRSSYKTAECRHQVVCLRCACVGHMAVRCPVFRSPNNKRIHVRSKKVGMTKEDDGRREVSRPVLPQVVHQERSEVGHSLRASLSIPLTPEVEQMREDLARVAVLSLEEGHVNDSSILEVAPTIINRTLAGPITPLNDCSFLIPLANREEVREVCKMGSFAVATKDGPCTLKLAPWSAEIGAVGRATDAGQWMHLWNFPLHGWSWGTIAEVVKPVGELVALLQATTPHKLFLSVLVRRRLGVVLPFELDLSMGMRRYSVLITGEKGVVPTFRHELDRYVLPEPRVEMVQ